MGALFAAAGIAGFVVLLVSNTNPDLRIVLPGSHQLELEKGSYTLFYEYRSQINGDVFLSDPNVPGIRFFVISPEDTGVELTVSSVNKRYEFSGRAGYSVLKFAIDSAGIYTVGGGFPQGVVGPDYLFAVGKSRSGSLLLAVISIVGGLGISAVLLIGTFLMRQPGRHRHDPSAEP